MEKQENPANNSPRGDSRCRTEARVRGGVLHLQVYAEVTPSSKMHHCLTMQQPRMSFLVMVSSLQMMHRHGLRSPWRRDQIQAPFPRVRSPATSPVAPRDRTSTSLTAPINSAHPACINSASSSPTLAHVVLTRERTTYSPPDPVAQRHLLDLQAAKG